MVFAISNHGLRNSGGIERYALTLVAGLHARGLRPVVVAKAFDRSLPEYGWCDARQVRVGALPSKLRDPYFDWQLRRLKARGGLSPLLACNQTGAADIAICGSTHPGFLEAMGQSPTWSDRWKIRIEHAHLHNAQVVVAHSQRMADEAQRFHGIPAAKLRLLYPPVDGDRFSAVDDETRARLRRKLGLDDGRAVFLLASTGHRRKGMDLLLEFFGATELPVTLLVAGRPIAQAVPANVRSLGYRSDIENIYRAVDCTVMASRYEPFGLVGVESALCGTPVLVAQQIGCAEVLRPPAGQAFDLDAAPDSAHSFAAVMAAAVHRWRAGTHRLRDPKRAIGYDTAVHTHVDALLQIARDLRLPAH